MTTPPLVRFLDRTTPPHILTLVLMAGLAAAAMNMYLPSLPKMAEHFDTSYRTMQLSVAVYLAVNAVMQLMIGPISDRYGRRPVMLVATIGFCLATIGTIFAPTAQIFLIFRGCQAISVAGLVLSRAIVRDMVPQNQAASMIGYVTMGMALVPMIAPSFGGLLDAAFGWKSIFWTLLLLGIGLFALIWMDQGETAAMAASKSLSDQFSEAPELFTSPRFWGYCLASTFASGAFFAYLGGAPFVGGVVFGLEPTLLGFLLGAPALGYVLGNGISGRYAERAGINKMILLGVFLNTGGLGCALALFLLGFGAPAVFFGFMTFVGLGNGLVLPNATAGMLSVRPSLAGTASGLGGAMMIGGGAALSALAGALLRPETGAFPLLWMMWLTSLGAIGAIGLVLWRETQRAV
ncbi:MAG: multidrug effflux MFS transporter [Mangrovicoccus sp.]